MGLVDKTVVIKWNPRNKNRLENKGYIYTKMGDDIEVLIEDLSKGCHVKVKCKCDRCGQEYSILFQDYTRSKRELDKIYCYTCSYPEYRNKSIKDAVLKNTISFDKWCLDNNRQDLLDRWDYDLNEFKPSETCYATNKKYWFKCPRGLHKSELKIINVCTNKNTIMRCNQCNSFGQWLIDNYGDDSIEKYWSYKNMASPFEIGHGSNDKVLLTCQSCEEEKLITPASFIRQELGCSKCSDGVSYPEKFIKSMLDQLNENHISQLTRTTFKWCEKYKYDKYLVKRNIIIEINGMQHYEESTRGRSLKEEQENDKIKKQLAYSNGFNEDNYIVIDARYPNLKYIKNSVMKSKLPQLLNFKEEDIDWLKCHKYGLNSYVKLACDYWNNGIHNTSRIANIMGLITGTIVIYLKKGQMVGWCNYNPEEEKKKNIINKSKPVYCVELNKIFISARDADRKLKIGFSNISKCCLGKQKTAGGYHWSFVSNL